MDVILQSGASLRGTVRVPPDKSIAHRGVLLAALADGPTELRPWPSGDDCQRTAKAVEALGITIDRSTDAVTVHGRGLGGLRAPADPIDCGESGTTLRLAAGLLAGQPFSAQLTASPSLARRPMQRIVQPLTRMGARMEGRASSEPAQELYPPLTIHGRRPLHPIAYEMPVASAQVKSAILLAGLFADGPTTVIEPSPTRDHTERLLRHCGISVASERRRVTVTPGTVVSPGLLRIPGDLSSAAFLVVAALCVPGSRVVLEDVSLNPSRTGVLAVLRRMGARIEETHADEGWEPSGALTVEAQPLQAVRLAPEEIPAVIDELPVLMVAAACARGTSRFEGVAELKVKETDRVRSMMEGLRRLGAQVTLPAPDVVEITGGTLSGACVESAGDHRTAMSLSVAALAAAGQTRVAGAECVAKSFPDFFGRLGGLAGSSTVKTVDKGGTLC